MLAYLLLSGITNGALYALIALGIVIVFKASGAVNLAHGDVFMVCGFVAYTLHVSCDVPYWLTVPLAACAGFLIGLAAERVAFRPVLKHGLVSVLLATIGLSFILKGLARYVWAGLGDVVAFPPVVDNDPILFGDTIVLPQQLVTLGGAIAVMLAFTAFFRFTRLGKQMQATADNKKAATLVGIQVGRIYMLTFALSGAVGGTAAVLMAPLTMLYPDLGFSLFLKAFAAAVLGGLTSIPGAVLGGLLIGIIEALAAGYISTGLQDISAFFVIMFAMVFMPTGLLGERRTRLV
jgi:branched-chain amino acid transport system permease protein